MSSIGAATEDQADTTEDGSTSDGEPLPPVCRVFDEQTPLRWEVLVDPDHFAGIHQLTALPDGGVAASGGLSTTRRVVRYDAAGLETQVYDSPGGVFGVLPAPPSGAELAIFADVLETFRIYEYESGTEVAERSFDAPDVARLWGPLSGSPTILAATRQASGPTRRTFSFGTTRSSSSTSTK